MRGFPRQSPARPLALLFVLLLGVSLPGGCAWWEKTITRPVKRFVEGRLTVTSDPPGAEVFVNDVFQGKTPLTLTYKIKVGDKVKGLEVLVQREGYLPLRRTVSPQTKKVTFRLIRRGRRR